jgi:hypothetical protein
MSERPTPETDCESGFFDMETAVGAAFARRLERERDEAREISKAASKGISKTARLNQFLLSELIAVRKERDELKEIASEFAMTASHCLGWHENKNPNQITSALSRWLKISTNELDA